LTGKVKSIDELLVKEEIQKYTEVKIRHKRKQLLAETPVNGSD
jgi:hypothetical protein